MAEPGLLDDVRLTAEAVLEAQAGGGDPAEAARQSLSAARAALDGGHPIAAIAAAEAEGERAARDRLGAQVLRAVERTAKKKRDSAQEHDEAVALAVRLGLAARDIAARAGVSHGTVTAVARRREQTQATAPPSAAPLSEDVVDTGESAPGSGAD